MELKVTRGSGVQARLDRPQKSHVHMHTERLLVRSDN